MILHYISDSAWCMFQGNTHWWSGVPTMPCSYYFCGFGRHTPMVPLACCWNHVFCWGTHILIILASHFFSIGGSLSYLFVGWAYPTGLVEKSCPLRITHTWSFLWMIVFLFRISLCDALLMVLIHIVFHPPLFFFVYIWYFITKDVSLCLDASFIQYVD